MSDHSGGLDYPSTVITYLSTLGGGLVDLKGGSPLTKPHTTLVPIPPMLQPCPPRQCQALRDGCMNKSTATRLGPASGGWGATEPHQVVRTSAAASACPLDHLPARHAVSDDEPVVVDLPLGVHGAHSLDCLLVRRPRLSFARVVATAPDAGCQVAEIPVGCPEPIPASVAAVVKPGDMSREMEKQSSKGDGV